MNACNNGYGSERSFHVGIVTFYRGFNFGSILQAYALSKFVSALGYRGVLVDYANLALPHNFLLRIRTLTVRLAVFLKKPRFFVKYFRARFHKKKSLSLLSKITMEKFSEFRENYLPITTKNYLEKKNSMFHAFICGSDQIWSSNMPGLGEVNFLRFAEEHKRIAYAPSFGSDTVPDYNRKRLAKYLREIPHLSVREQSGVKIIKELTGRDAVLVLDPVLPAGLTNYLIFIIFAECLGVLIAY